MYINELKETLAGKQETKGTESVKFFNLLNDEDIEDLHKFKVNMANHMYKRYINNTLKFSNIPFSFGYTDLADFKVKGIDFLDMELINIKEGNLFKILYAINELLSDPRVYGFLGSIQDNSIFSSLRVYDIYPYTRKTFNLIYVLSQTSFKSYDLFSTSFKSENLEDCLSSLEKYINGKEISLEVLENFISKILKPSNQIFKFTKMGGQFDLYVYSYKFDPNEVLNIYSSLDEQDVAMIESYISLSADLFLSKKISFLQYDSISSKPILAPILAGLNIMISSVYNNGTFVSNSAKTIGFLRKYDIERELLNLSSSFNFLIPVDILKGRIIYPYYGWDILESRSGSLYPAFSFSPMKSCNIEPHENICIGPYPKIFSNATYLMDANLTSPLTRKFVSDNIYILLKYIEKIKQITRSKLSNLIGFLLSNLTLKNKLSKYAYLEKSDRQRVALEFSKDIYEFLKAFKDSDVEIKSFEIGQDFQSLEESKPVEIIKDSEPNQGLNNSEPNSSLNDSELNQSSKKSELIQA